MRKQGNKRKYYLAHSFRFNGKVRKIRQYLGSDLNAEQLEGKRKAAEKAIEERTGAYKTVRDPFKTAMSPTELEQLKTLEAKGGIRIRHLTEDEWLKFSEKFVYDTNAIEGSTVTLSEVSGMLEKNNWPGKRTKWEISETYGLSDAVRYVRETGTALSLDLIRKLHELVFRNSKPFGGKFRSTGEEVAVVDAAGNIIHKGAPSSLITRLLSELIAWYDENQKKYPPIVLAVVVHNQFEIIHPFRDGNGRVGRLLLNFILLKHNLPPVNIELKNRKEYYRALREYQNNNDIRPSIELVLKEYRNLKKIIEKR